MHRADFGITDTGQLSGVVITPAFIAFDSDQAVLDIDLYIGNVIKGLYFISGSDWS